MNRAALVRASVAAALPLLFASCGGGIVSDQHRPHIVSYFPADGQVLSGWLGEIRVTFDEPVVILDETAVAVIANGEETITTAYRDPFDPNSIVVLQAAHHLTPGLVHVVQIREGVVKNSAGHYLADEFDWSFTAGPRPNVFVASSNGSVYEIDPDDGSQAGATAPPAGFAAVDVLGGDNEVFVWLKNLGVGSDVLAYFVPGAATMTPIALAGETGTVVGVGFTLSIDGRTLYVTARDGSNQKVRVHRVSVLTRAEFLSSIELTPLTPLPALARRPCVDPERNRLYVAHADGSGGGLLSVVDLGTFTQIDADGSPGLAAVLPDGAGDLTYGPITDRAWMTLPERPNAALLVIDPDGFAQYGTSEETLTQGPVSSALTPDEHFFLQGLTSYSGTLGLVASPSNEIGDGAARDVLDDVGGVLQGSNRIGALLYDPGSRNMLVFASDGASTVLCTYNVFDYDVLQMDSDLVTPGTQGLDLSTTAPGAAVSATFLLGALAP